jgi:hypothetical protein
MNPNYMEHKFPQIKPHPFNRVRFKKLIFRSKKCLSTRDVNMV